MNPDTMRQNHDRVTDNPSAPPGRISSPSKRKTFYAWHSWAGFQLSVLTFIVLLSGTLAVISNEIDWLLDSDRRIPAHQGDVAWDAMYVNARALLPSAQLLSLQLGELPVMAAEAHLRTTDGLRTRIYLNPADGSIVGTGSWLNVQRLLRDFHRYLFILAGGLGLPIVSIAAVVLAIQLITGLVTTRKWLRGLITLPRRKNTRVMIGDLHRFGALWTTWFSILMVVTSAWYFAEWAMQKSGARVAAPIEGVVAPNNGVATLPNSIADHVNAATAAYPQLQIRSITLPGVSSDQLVMTGPSTDWMLRDRASRVTVDAQSAQVLAVQTPGGLTSLQYLADLADPWHFGEVGGLWTKLLWFVCGLILTGLCGTGVWLSWRRSAHLVGRWHAACAASLLISGAFGVQYVGHYLG